MTQMKLVWKVVIVIVVVSIFGTYLLLPESLAFNIQLSEEQIKTIPVGPVHWHPKLTITIDSQHVPIPTGIGIDIGRRVDTQLNGMGMSPTHTHESDGTIHIENSNARAKPETLTLGYFFYAWDKKFNSTCVFNYCTDNGTLKMTVNGKENNEFQHYIMRDKDVIKIEYISLKEQ